MRKLPLILILVLAAVPAFGQTAPSQGTVGLGMSISGVAAFNTFSVATVSNGLNASYWATNEVVLVGGLGLVSENNAGTDFSVDLGVLYHFNRSQFSPVVGGDFFVGVISPDVGGSTTQVGFNFGGGAEYYFSRNFGVMITEGLQFHSEPTTFAFVSRLGLNWYF